MAFAIQAPYENFTGLDGLPLTGGYVYIGAVGLDPVSNPIPVFWDENLTIPATQPLRTNAGYIVRLGTPSRVYTATNYSITVNDVNSVTVYYVANFGVVDYQSANGAAFIGGGVQHVNTFTELRALSKNSPSKFASVSGYDYYLDAADISSADNGGSVIVATDGARWKYRTHLQRPAGFFVGNGSRPERFGDRVFMGDAVVGDGAFPGTVHDWLYNYMNPYFSPSGNTPPSATTAMVSLAGGTGSPLFGQAILGGASSAAAASTGGNAIGVQGYGVANNTLGGDFGWGLYAEGHRAASTASYCYGAEICVVNRGNVKSTTPYLSEDGSTIGLQIDSGVGFPVAQMTGIASASSALVVVDNGGGTVPFLNGIVFTNNSLSGTNGADAGHGEAIVMAKGHRVRWYKPGNVAGPAITSDVNAGVNTNLSFTDSGFQIQNASGQSMAQFTNAAASPNGFNFDTTGSPGYITISAVGTGPNVSIKLQPLGTGLVQFGTWTGAPGTINGFILVLDAFGNQRKLATTT